MPTYTVEVVTTGRKVYEVKDAACEETAKETARQRHEQNAPIDLVHESCIVTEVRVTGDETTSMR
jgi:hypothetical protein